MNTIDQIRQNPQFLFVAAYVAWVGILVPLVLITYQYLKHVFSKTNPLMTFVIRQLKTPVILFVFLSGFLILRAIIVVPAYWEKSLDMTSKMIVIIFLIYVVDKLFRAFFRHALVATHFLKSSGKIIENVIRALILLLGGMIILDGFGISITPLIASLGVGSLAVALALQDTLTHLFAGFHLSFEKSLSIGDSIKIESGAEGVIEEIGARFTRIRLSPHHLVLVPNSKLVNSIITKVYQNKTPLAAKTIIIALSISPNADIEKVESICKETARGLEKIVKQSNSASVTIESMDRHAISISTVLQIDAAADEARIRHEFFKTVLTRFKSEAIPLPSSSHPPEQQKP